ncbi:hypothetical protein FRC06_002590 [Ceratobasidium sp. 370]|nr:hypothetical protein FRC06_002590 [Ceratobasidium sp. 370]
MDSAVKSSYVYPLAASLLLVVLARLAYLWLLPKPIPHIPHNPITSIWGDVPDIMRFTEDGKRTFADYIAEFVDKHGPLCQVMVGRNPMVLVAERAEIERVVLRGKNTDQLKRTNEIMSRRYLGRMSVRSLAEANNLVHLWSRKLDLAGEKAFEADTDLQLASLDAIVNITVGTSPRCIDTSFAALSASLSASTLGPNLVQFSQHNSLSLHSVMRVMMQGIERVRSSAFPALTARLFLWTSPSWRKAYNTLTTFFTEEIVRARVREGEITMVRQGGGLATDADCVLDMLLQREAREGTEKLSQRELLDELLTYVIAGQDSTASALAWLVKFLASDAEVQRRLRHEMCTVFGPESNPDAPLDYNALDDAEQVPILEAVVAETLRCAKVGSLTGRELTGDEVILGRHIPKGTQLMFPIAFMATRESEWGPDAKVWRPDRWLRADGSFNRAAGPSLVFGLGQRSCFGQRLAIAQIKVFIATLSRAFFFKPVPPEVDSWDAVEVVTRQPKCCYVSLEKWSSESN